MRSLIIFLVICVLAGSCGFFLGPFFFDGPAASTCPNGLCLRHKVVIVVSMILFLFGPAILGEYMMTPEAKERERRDCNKRGIY